jgi:biotin--protein ligase
MDVLVYAEPTQHSQATIDALATLRSLLLPRYSVQTLTPQALKSQPWRPSCALLVILQSQNVFPSQECSKIKEYVESGGSFLGFGFGAKCISHGRGTVDASKDLQFQIGDESTSVVISSFVHQENHSSQSVAIATPDGELIDGVKDNCSSKFVGLEGVKGVNILANYHGGDHGTTIAGLTCQCGRGTAAFWAPSLESPLEESLSEQRRLALLRSTLLSLNLQPPPSPEKVSHPLPQYLTSHPSKPTIVSKIMDSIAMPSPGSQLSVFGGGDDTFHFHRLEESESLVTDIRNSPQSSDPSKWQPKHIILCLDTLPSRNHTPLFDIELYYESLSAARAKEGSSDNAIPWGMGEVLLYGEIVTSTQTLLDK